LRYAIERGDSDVALGLIELGLKYSTGRAIDNDSATKFAIKDDEFEAALRHGRIDVLSVMISQTGYSMPFRKLVHGSGEMEQESKVLLSPYQPSDVQPTPLIHLGPHCSIIKVCPYTERNVVIGQRGIRTLLSQRVIFRHHPFSGPRSTEIWTLSIGF
jgi:hypothetical protein